MKEQLIYESPYPFRRAFLGILAGVIGLIIIQDWSLITIGIFILMYYFFCLYPFCKISIYTNKVEVHHPLNVYSRYKEFVPERIKSIVFNNVATTGPLFFIINTTDKKHTFPSSISKKDQEHIILHLKELRIEAYTIPDGTFWF